jgi:hypothetical protein
VTRRVSLVLSRADPLYGPFAQEQFTGGILNKNQKRTLMAVIVLILVMFLFPPFQAVLPNGVVHNMGYQWIFHPPMKGLIPAVVNVPMLLLQLLGVLLVGGLVFFLTKNQSPTSARAGEEMRADSTGRPPVNHLAHAETDSSTSDAGATELNVASRTGPSLQRSAQLTLRQKITLTLGGALLIYGCVFMLLTSYVTPEYQGQKNTAAGWMFYGAAYFAYLWKARNRRAWVGVIVGIAASLLVFFLQGIASGYAKQQPNYVLEHTLPFPAIKQHFPTEYEAMRQDLVSAMKGKKPADDEGIALAQGKLGDLFARALQATSDSALLLYAQGKISTLRDFAKNDPSGCYWTISGTFADADVTVLKRLLAAQSPETKALNTRAASKVFEDVGASTARVDGPWSNYRFTELLGKLDRTLREKHSLTGRLCV